MLANVDVLDAIEVDFGHYLLLPADGIEAAEKSISAGKSIFTSSCRENTGSSKGSMRRRHTAAETEGPRPRQQLHTPTD